MANLFLVRAEGRQQEIALRVALGAARGRLAREFLAESLALAALGGIAGLGLANGAVQFLLALKPQSLPRLHAITIDPNVLTFAIGISIFTGVVFGLVPVLKYGTPRLGSALKEGGRASSDGRERHRARGTLVVSQIALALVLLISSGLMVRSFQALRRVQPGFIRPGEVLTLKIIIPEAEIQDIEQTARAHEQILGRIERIPGVVSAGLSSSITMDGWDSNDGIYVEEFPTEEGQIPKMRRFKWVSEGYFKTMGNPLIAGRPITWDDIHRRTPVAVVTENFTREYWQRPSEAVGKRIRESRESPWREIVGVVGNVHDDGVSQEATATIYWPMVQRDFWGNDLRTPRMMGYAIRTPRLHAAGFLEEIRSAVDAVNPNLAIAGIYTLQELYDQSLARTTFALIMLAIASTVAMLLGAIGIYGVISYAVSRRTREIGVRMALGARRLDVSQLILRDAGALTLVGLIVGMVASALLTRLMSSLLFGVDPVDFRTYALVSLLLGAIALTASYVPARRAAKVHPTEALRWE